MAWRTVMAGKGKTESVVDVVELSGDERSRSSDSRPTHEAAFEEAWTPGKNVPWIAAVEIGIAVLCTIAAIIVVTLSDGKRQGSWYIPATKHTKQVTIEPKLLLSVLSSVLSLMLGLAFKEGLTVSWWTRALVGGNIRDLERHWSTGSSVLKAALAGKYLTHAALGLLLITATGILESTLMQRATNVGSELVNDPLPFNTTSQLASKLPFTGWLGTRGYFVDSFDPIFAGVMREWTSNAPITSNFTACNGTCSAVVPGAGVFATCTPSSTTKTVGPDQNLTDFNSTYPSRWNKTHTIFQTSFDTAYYTTSDFGYILNITMDIISSSAVTNEYGGCNRTFLTQSCVLQPAIVQYPVTLTGNTVALDKTALGGSPFYAFERNLTLSDNSDQLMTTMGGIYLALNDSYTSQAQQTWQGEFDGGWERDASGPIQNTYYTPGLDGPDYAGYTCNETYHDPTADLVTKVNDLMLRLAVNSSSVADQAVIQAVPTGLLNYYQSDFRFLAIAVALVWLNIFVIVPMFYGWWHIGRKISLNPIEVADAFNAPVFQKDRPHRDVSELIDHVGHRPVVFRPVEHALEVDGGTRVFKAMKIVTPQEHHLD